MQHAEGLDVVAGYVEMCKRAETEQLLEELEILPPRLVEYRDTKLRESDLDGSRASAIPSAGKMWRNDTKVPESKFFSLQFKQQHKSTPVPLVLEVRAFARPQPDP